MGKKQEASSVAVVEVAFVDEIWVEMCSQWQK